MFTDIIRGFADVFTLEIFAALVIGSIVGLIIGALPGLSANMAVALTVPLTFTMEPVVGISLLSAIYCSGIYGGSISAILLGIPGTISSFATTFDGYPMNLKGRSNEALGIATVASVLGGLFSATILMLLAPQLAEYALRFGPSEYFAITLLGLACLASVGRGSVCKSLISGVFGLLVATVGMDPTTGTLRFTFNNAELMDGIGLVPALTGVFGVLAVIKLAEHANTGTDLHDIPKVGSIWIGWKKVRKLMPTMMRGSVIGTITGIIPGIGTSVATVVAYDVEKKVSKTPEEFGRGKEEGVAAPESANNSLTGGSMIPLLALGIPGNATSALFLGALLIHGISTGPTMFTNNGNVVYALFAAFFMTNILMGPICILLLKYIRLALTLDERLLGGAIIAFCMTGIYSIESKPMDILIMVIFGVLGYFFYKVKIPTSPMIIGLALGSLAEKSLWQALTINNGSVSFFWQRPITAVVMAVSILSFLLPFFSGILKKKRILK